jgi:basic amino acid/polyamine antiporter, APA family
MTSEKPPVPLPQASFVKGLGLTSATTLVIGSMIMSGVRVYFTMAHGDLFFRRAGTLDPVHHTPVFALAIQCLWTMYNDLLDYVIFAVLLFCILTIGGLFRLRRTRPNLNRPYRAVGYPVLPAVYMLVAGVSEILLPINKPTFTIRGLILVLLGVPVYFLWNRRAGASPLRGTK